MKRRIIILSASAPVTGVGAERQLPACGALCASEGQGALYWAEFSMTSGRMDVTVRGEIGQKNHTDSNIFGADIHNLHLPRSADSDCVKM